MEDEIKKPFFNRPEMIVPPYDYKNYELAGKYRGPGDAGKVGSFSGDTSIETMPSKVKIEAVPRDKNG